MKADVKNSLTKLAPMQALGGKVRVKQCDCGIERARCTRTCTLRRGGREPERIRFACFLADIIASRAPSLTYTESHWRQIRENRY